MRDFGRLLLASFVKALSLQTRAVGIFLTGLAGAFGIVLARFDGIIGQCCATFFQACRTRIVGQFARGVTNVVRDLAGTICLLYTSPSPRDRG